MKILIVGSTKHWAIENIYKKELTAYAEVEIFNAHGFFHDYYYASVLNKLKYRLGLSGVLKKINEDLLLKVEEYKPEVVWVFKGMEVFPKTLKRIKRRGVVLVNYNPDHPFSYQSKGAGNKNVLGGIHLYDHHFTYSTQIKKDLEAKYSVSVTWLPFAYVKEQKNRHAQFIKRICFIGNPDNERARIIKLLIKHKIPLVIFGNNWMKFIGEPNEILAIHPATYKEDFVRIAQKYAVQLNLFRRQNEGSHNMRTFEMPALGCLMLAPRSEEHLKLFTEGKEAEYFEDEDELVKQANRLINLSDVKIHEYQENAYQRTIVSGYSYSDRAEQVFHTFKGLMQAKV